MSDFRLEIDLEGILAEFKDVKDEMHKAVVQGAESLATMTHARVLELARDELGSLSKKYMDSVSYKKLEEGLWVVSLDMDKAGFIEDGRKSGFMSELLEGKSAKTSKDGKKYAVIPFEHSKNPSEQSTKAKQLADQIKTALKNEGIHWQKIEKNPDGTPRVGLLHKINVNNPRLKEAHKTSATQGIAVYQRKDKSGTVSKQVMTFRVISEKHRNEGLWIHPGSEGKKLIDKSFEWAVRTWENDMLPTILDSIGSKR